VRLALSAGAVLLLTPPAAAQMGPGGFGAPGGGMQPPPAQGSEKEEGPAEAAPEENRPVDLEPLTSYPEQTKRKMQIFELSGYLRLRDDYMHDFFLGLGYSTVPSGSTVPGTVNYGLPPFPVPLDCPSPANTAGGVIGSPATGGTPAANCPTKNMGGANLRFRLEPTLNVTDQVRVHAQIDVLDNTIMGSTPDSLAGIQGFNTPPPTAASGSVSQTSMPPGVAPSQFLANNQDPPEIGQNGFTSSVRAKRAWAEIDTEFGSIYFGRMPWNWGRGIFFNDGSCADCDVGTTVDRVMAMTTIYGHQLKFAWDLGAQGDTTQQLSLGRLDPSGYPYDLSQNDDVLQLMASVARVDSPVELREKIDRGDVVANYGVQLVYRNQGNVDAVPTMTLPMTQFGPQPLMPDQIPTSLAYGAYSFTPDVWFKLYYKALTIEAEGTAILGHIDHPGALAVDGQALKLAQAGWVVASELRLFHDSLFVGFEVGGATGDQANNPGQYLNYRWRFIQQPKGDGAINDFHFSPDYHVDEIFFRHIMGTVTNATYFKPQAAYWFDLGRTRAIGISGGAIFSMAEIPVSTPGDALLYGIETDASAGYRNTAEGFYAGITWGVFWPLDALDRPSNIWGPDAASASAAQILRLNLGVKF
jgi:uncharacterized protein (TIGR04551 family)